MLLIYLTATNSFTTYLIKGITRFEKPYVTSEKTETGIVVSLNLPVRCDF